MKTWARMLLLALALSSCEPYPPGDYNGYRGRDTAVLPRTTDQDPMASTPIHSVASLMPEIHGHFAEPNNFTDFRCFFWLPFGAEWRS